MHYHERHQHNPKYVRSQFMRGCNVSRALGDTHQKVIIAKPKITVTQLIPGDTLILCCDGLIDCKSVDQTHIIDRINECEDAQELAQQLTVDGLGSGDNVSIIVIKTS